MGVLLAKILIGWFGLLCIFAGTWIALVEWQHRKKPNNGEPK